MAILFLQVKGAIFCFLVNSTVFWLDFLKSQMCYESVVLSSYFSLFNNVS